MLVRNGMSSDRAGNDHAAFTAVLEHIGMPLAETRVKLGYWLGIAPVFIFAGTYEMLNMLGVNGQSGRRSIDAPFPHYDFRIKEHVGAFKGVIRTFQQSMQLPQTPDIDVSTSQCL